jgi:class 3 adenylate cyclase
MRSGARSAGRHLATVLFTDIVSSTELAARIGDRQWRAVLAAYRAMVRETLRRTRGREIDDAGDGFFAVFEHPADAITCACLLAQEVRSQGLEVRSGIHMGEVETTGAKLGGIAVHIGARVCAQAGAGEVLVSSTVRDVVRGSEFGFVDLGARPLKGVPGEMQLFRVTWTEGQLTAVATRNRRTWLIAGAGGVAAVVIAAAALVALVPRHTGVAAARQIITVAGTGVDGDGPDGGQATATELGHPIAVAVDPGGRLYFVEDNRVRRINGNGTVTTIAGTGAAGFSGDGGPAVAAELNGPQSIAIDSVGDVFIADSLNNRIREVTPDGIITTIAGSSHQGYGGDSGPAADAALDDPTGVAIGFGGPHGSIVIADRGNNRVRLVTASGATFANAIISTVAGTGQASYEGDGHLAVNAELDSPQCVAVDSEDDIYIADVGNDLVRVVDAGGTIDPAAGDGTTGFAGDHAPATFAELDLASSGGGCLAVDAADHLFIADAANNRVREVVFNASGGGTITTVAGDGVDGFNGDNVTATATGLSLPLGIATGADGALYIAYSDANRIRRVG